MHLHSFILKLHKALTLHEKNISCSGHCDELNQDMTQKIPPDLPAISI